MNNFIKKLLGTKNQYKELMPAIDLQKEFFTKEFSNDHIFSEPLPDVIEYEESQIQEITKSSTNSERIKNQLKNMCEAALIDQGSLINNSKLDLEFFTGIDSFYSKNRILQLMNNKDIMLTIIELQSAFGQYLIDNHEFKWLTYNPYFTSVLVNENTSLVVSPFDIVLKRFARDSNEYNLKDKLDEIVYLNRRKLSKIQ